jgi:CBS-domain-containing membrane protein
MHDRKLLSDNELDGAALIGPALPATPSTKRTAKHAGFWAVIGFCVTGLVCSLYVPSSYLHLEQTAALLNQAPL